MLRYLLAKPHRQYINNCVTIGSANYYFHVFVESHNNGNSFFADIICLMCLLNLFSVYGTKCFREIYKQVCCFEIFCMYSFGDSTNCQNLKNYGSISQKIVLIFPEKFLNFRSDTIEKQSTINLDSYIYKSNASVVLCDSEVTFLWEGKDVAFRSFLFYVLFIHNVA